MVWDKIGIKLDWDHKPMPGLLQANTLIEIRLHFLIDFGAEVKTVFWRLLKDIKGAANA